MKIAILGYGKMGKMIEQVAKERGHEISLIITEDNPEDFNAENLSKVDVAIEFTMPESAANNIMTCIKHNCPVVSGTTGWLDKMDEVKAKLEQHNGSLVYSSNYSLGVNIFFALNKKLAAYLNPYSEYKVAIEEIHHTAKKDAPSGTAISLAEGTISNIDRYSSWFLTDNEETISLDELPISSLRIDPYPGTHTVRYSSQIDEIEIKHTAHTRYGFALGAVVAAEWLKDKHGFYSMSDVLGLN
jgi:4-hydroxy-tetrahydrodipicolinate reductase